MEQLQVGTHNIESHLVNNAEHTRDRDIASIRIPMRNNDEEIMKAKGLRYMTEEELKAKEVTGMAGGLKRAGYKAPLNGSYMYVVALDGRMYAEKNHLEGVLPKHSTFLSGGPVQTAGGITAKNGSITVIENKSGHYQPTPVQHLRGVYGLYKRNMVGEKSTRIDYLVAPTGKQLSGVINVETLLLIGEQTTNEFNAFFGKNVIVNSPQQVQVVDQQEQLIQPIMAQPIPPLDQPEQHQQLPDEPDIADLMNLLKLNSAAIEHDLNI